MIAQHIRDIGEAEVCTSIIVAAELRYGAAKKGSQRLTSQLEAVLGALEVLPFEAPADATYVRLRARLQKAGKPIGGNDLLIGAHALTLGCATVTDNEREFAQIEGLPRENWLHLPYTSRCSPSPEYECAVLLPEEPDEKRKSHPMMAFFNSLIL